MGWGWGITPKTIIQPKGTICIFKVGTFDHFMNNFRNLYGTIYCIPEILPVSNNFIKKKIIVSFLLNKNAEVL